MHTGIMSRSKDVMDNLHLNSVMIGLYIEKHLASKLLIYNVKCFTYKYSNNAIKAIMLLFY